MLFRNREEAARYLAERLRPYRRQNPLILAIPRGAAVMGRALADALGGELDVALVRKLRAPHQPELAIGSIDELGHFYLTAYARGMRLTDTYLEDEKRYQLDVLKRRRQRYSMGRMPIDVRDRVVIVVDDGIATGSTMIAALKAVRQGHPAKLIAAAAVAPIESVERVRPFADDVVCLMTPADFSAVGQFFEDFHEVTDDDVIALLKGDLVTGVTPDPPVSITVDGTTLHGDLAIPENAKGIAIFAHGSGSSRLSTRNRHVAEVLRRHGVGTLLFDLLTPEEDRVYENRFDIELLGRRLAAVTEWMAKQPQAKELPIGYFGASTGAAAALVAAAKIGSHIACIVSRGGRPDLALHVAARISAPTLLIVGGRDEIVVDLNRRAYDALPGIKELSIVPGASHLFEEPGTLDDAALRAADWFCRYLRYPKIITSSHGATTVASSHEVLWPIAASRTSENSSALVSPSEARNQGSRK
ncbi:MAG TPA: phosphoribosyltransferase family protein [Candidatus Krumholzibacteria bacterium]|nr:phosphoribosyltransferase family protein [Candidatus Krumholzibacteria bacterium]